jgi:hypothetical protein
LAQVSFTGIKVGFSEHICTVLVPTNCLYGIYLIHWVVSTSARILCLASMLLSEVERLRAGATGDSRQRRISMVGEREVQNLRLPELEARLQDLSERLPIFHGAAPVVRLSNSPHIFDPAFDLGDKVDRVRWMLRVAKHTQGPVLDRILQTVANLLDQLEKTVDPKSHAA